jgi:hypothetical protein
MFALKVMEPSIRSVLRLSTARSRDSESKLRDEFALKFIVNGPLRERLVAEIVAGLLVNALRLKCWVLSLNSIDPERLQWNNKLHLASRSSIVACIKRFDASINAFICFIFIDKGSCVIVMAREVSFAVNSVIRGLFNTVGEPCRFGESKETTELLVVASKSSIFPE